MPKKDKAAVIDEVWTEERVRDFLHLQPPQGRDPDFHVLLRSYQSMRTDDFQKLVKFFQGAGRNLSAPGPDGRTVLEIVATHRNSGEYADILRRAGAEK